MRPDVAAAVVPVHYQRRVADQHLHKALGLVPHFGHAWLGAWGWSWLVAFRAVRVVLPLVRRLTAMFVDMRSP